MSDIETAFNGDVSDSFAGHAETIRGYIRYELVRRNLQPIITQHTMQIVDVGGGTATEAIWLAGLGHSVTIVDPASDQLERAHQKIAQLPSEQASRILLIEGTADDLLDQGYVGQFDLALSHGVAMYLDEPALFIRSVARLVKPGHWLSLLEKGFYGARASLMHEGRYDEVKNLERTGRLTNHLGRDVWAFKPEALLDVLKDGAKADRIQWTGVRVLRDFDDRRTSDVSLSELAAIVDQEYQAGTRRDLRAGAPMLHFIARTLRPA